MTDNDNWTPRLPPGARALVRVIVFAMESQPGVVSVDVTAGGPVGDITPDEVACAVGITADSLAPALAAVWDAVRAESN